MKHHACTIVCVHSGIFVMWLHIVMVVNLNFILACSWGFTLLLGIDVAFTRSGPTQ